MNTVKVSVYGVLQNAEDYKGCIRFKLCRPCAKDDTIVIPQDWQEVGFDEDGSAVAELIPNSVLGGGTYYTWQILRKEACLPVPDKAIRGLLVQEGVCVVPDNDCCLVDITTVEPTQDEPIEASKAYASEAKSAALSAIEAVDVTDKATQDVLCLVSDAQAVKVETEHIAEIASVYASAASESAESASVRAEEAYVSAEKASQSANDASNAATSAVSEYAINMVELMDTLTDTAENLQQQLNYLNEKLKSMIK